MLLDCKTWSKFCQQSSNGCISLSHPSIQTTFYPRTNRLANGAAEQLYSAITTCLHCCPFLIGKLLPNQRRTIYSFLLPPAFSYSFAFAFSFALSFSAPAGHLRFEPPPASSSSTSLRLRPPQRLSGKLVTIRGAKWLKPHPAAARLADDCPVLFLQLVSSLWRLDNRQ